MTINARAGNKAAAGSGSGAWFNLPTMTGVPAWLPAWLALSGLIVIYDASYCLLRPRSMPGGDLFHVFKPYKLYGEADQLYGTLGWKHNDGFCSAQAAMNLVEVALQFTTLALWRRGRHAGTLVAFVAQLMTLAKTLLYWLCEVFSGWKYTGHNSFQQAMLLLVLTNGFWIALPAVAVAQLGRNLSAALELAADKPKRG